MSDPTEPTTSTAAEPVDPWQVPLYCHHCDAEWAVRRAAFRTGQVLRCPRCRAMYVVQTDMFRTVDALIADLERRGVAATSDEARGELANLTHTFRPPGVARPTAGVFG